MPSQWETTAPLVPELCHVGAGKKANGIFSLGEGEERQRIKLGLELLSSSLNFLCFDLMDFWKDYK